MSPCPQVGAVRFSVQAPAPALSHPNYAPAALRRSIVESRRGIASPQVSMLKHQLIHPKINEILARAGHHGQVLIADGNYPASSTLGPNAELVSLNLSPGIVNCSQVLEALLSAIPVEAAHTMLFETSGPYALDADPPVWAEYRRLIAAAGLKIELEPIEKWAFYEAVNTPSHVLTIQTADQQRFANVLLTIGVRS